MIFPVHRSRHRHLGFSLVELMVAVAIGLFGVITMTQIFIFSEQNKRAATSGGDAMNEGVTALYALQRDVRMGGFGISDVKLLGCNTLLRAGVTLVAMAPVTVNHASIPAGDANTDTLLVVYATSNGSPQGDSVVAQPATPPAGGVYPDVYSVQTAASFLANDWVIATPAVRNCATTGAPLTPSLTLTQVASVATPNIAVVAGTGVVVVPITIPTYPTIFNLGPNVPRVIAYAVRNGNLTMCDYTVNDCSSVNAAFWVPIASNIVSLRAQYGRDTAAAGAMDGVVDVYDQTAPATACDWARVAALRLVLVARSVEPSASVTTVAPVWDGSATTPIDLTGNSAWQNYRYKVFQTIVPLRNISWMGVVPTC